MTFSTIGKSGKLPDYSFVEPNYKDHEVEEWHGRGIRPAPCGNVHVARASTSGVPGDPIQSAIWESSALLIVYDDMVDLRHVRHPLAPR